MGWREEGWKDSCRAASGEGPVACVCMHDPVCVQRKRQRDGGRNRERERVNGKERERERWMDREVTLRATGAPVILCRCTSDGQHVLVAGWVTYRHCCQVCVCVCGGILMGWDFLKDKLMHAVFCWAKTIKYFKQPETHQNYCLIVKHEAKC